MVKRGRTCKSCKTAATLSSRGLPVTGPLTFIPTVEGFFSKRDHTDENTRELPSLRASLDSKRHSNPGFRSTAAREATRTATEGEAADEGAEGLAEASAGLGEGIPKSSSFTQETEADHISQSLAITSDPAGWKEFSQCLGLEKGCCPNCPCPSQNLNSGFSATFRPHESKGGSEHMFRGSTMKASDFVDCLSENKKYLWSISQQPCTQGQAEVNKKQNIYSITNCSGSTVYFNNPGEKTSVMSFEKFVHWFKDNVEEQWFKGEASPSPLASADELGQVSQCLKANLFGQPIDGAERVKISDLVDTLMKGNCKLEARTTNEICPSQILPPGVSTYRSDGDSIQFDLRTGEAKGDIPLVPNGDLTRYEFVNCKGNKEEIFDKDGNSVVTFVSKFLDWFLYGTAYLKWYKVEP